MTNSDARTTLVQTQRLMQQYLHVGRACHERAPAGRRGVVVGVEPNGKDLHWLAEGETQPQRCKVSDLDIGQAGKAPDWLGSVLAEAIRERAFWPARFLIQFGLASGPDYWPAAISLAIMKSRGLAPRDSARAEKLLQLVVPFVEALPPEDAADLLAQTPELRQLASQTGPSSKTQRVRFKSLAKPSWRYLLGIQLPLRLMVSGALPMPDLEHEDGDEPDDGLGLGPEDFDDFLPLEPLYDADQRPVFFLSSSVFAVQVLTEEGSVETLDHEDFDLDLHDDGAPMTGAEFTDVLEMAWQTRTSAAFTLGAHLARHLGDLDAAVFWAVYGYRWLRAHGDYVEAVMAMEEGCIALYRDAAAAAAWAGRYPDFAQALLRPPLDTEGTPLPQLPVADLAPHWRPEFGLLAMARRVHGNPEFLQGGVDIFSFGHAPFQHGAPPPPPLDADDPEPYAIWRSPPPAAPVISPAPEAPAVLAEPQPAAPEASPPVMPVQFAEHALLQTEWNLPSGQDAFLAARGVVFGWLASKLGVTIPERWSIGAHEVEHKGLRLEVEASEELAAVRFEHPDHEHAARRWRVELVIGAGVGGRPGVVTLRLLAQDATRLPAPTTATPRFLRDLLQAPGLLLAGRPLGQLWRVGTNVDWLALRDVLQQTDRDFVLLVTGPEERLELSAALAPLALHVKLLPASAPDYARRRTPVAPGTCHLYALGQTQPRVVPATLAQLTPALWAAHADRRALPPVPTFADLRRQLRDLALVRRLRVVTPDPVGTAAHLEGPSQTATATASPATGSSELEELLQLELEEVLAKNRGLEADLETLTGELREAKAALFAARAAAGESTPVAVHVDRPPVPKSFAELEAWAPLLGDRLHVAPKAIKEAMSITDYQNEQVAIAALDALHEHYWPMVMRGDEQARERWHAFLKENRLRCGPVGTAPESSRYGSSYEVTVGRKKYTMDMHIQGHSARDTRRCLRIYFAVDRENPQRIVVGHLPTHLPCHIQYVS